MSDVAQRSTSTGYRTEQRIVANRHEREWQMSFLIYYPHLNEIICVTCIGVFIRGKSFSYTY